MSDQSDFETLLPTLQAIAASDIKTCPMPIGLYAQEAENLFHWANQDRELLLGAGLDGNLLDELPMRVGALREAEARWQLEFRTRKEASERWARESPEAYQLRDNLLRSFRYAFRKHEDLLQKVALVAEGEGHADMIQDLSTLVVLGRAQSELLAGIHFDVALLDTAAQTVDELATLLAAANGEKLGDNDGRALRDQAYTFLHEAVEEIRACGKYVFFDNDARSRGYTSAVYRYRNRAGSKSKTETVEVAEAPAEI